MVKMGVLKFKKGGIEFEYIGEPSEIEQLVQRLTTAATYNMPAQQHFPPHTEAPQQTNIVAKLEKPASSKTRRKTILPLPTNEEVKKYIMSKPDFAHDIADVQQHFYGTNFKSRGDTQSMYFRTSRQVVEIRKQIEKEENGQFTPYAVEKNLMRYVFKKIPVVTALEEKPTS
jgi:hypothetical protein